MLKSNRTKQMESRKEKMQKFVFEKVGKINSYTSKKNKKKKKEIRNNIFATISKTLFFFIIEIKKSFEVH